MRRRFASAGWLIGLALLLQQAETLSTTTLTAPKPASTAVQQLGEFNVAQLAEYEAGLEGVNSTADLELSEAASALLETSA